MTQYQLMTDKPYSDGLPAQLVILENKQCLRVTLMDIGATWLSCIVPIKGEEREVLLGVNSLADFESQTAYLGSTIGRYASRINGGQLKIGSQSYQLDTNENGNTLHGGSQGFDKRRWQIAEQTPTSVLFTLTSIALKSTIAVARTVQPYSTSPITRILIYWVQSPAMTAYPTV